MNKGDRERGENGMMCSEAHYIRQVNLSPDGCEVSSFSLSPFFFSFSSSSQEHPDLNITDESPIVRHETNASKSDKSWSSRTMDNLNNVWNPETETVDGVLGTSGWQFLASWEDVTLTYQRMFFRNRIFHSTYTFFQHFTFVPTYLLTWVRRVDRNQTQ